MFSQKLDQEGFQTCIALVLLIQHGKTNTFGKLQHVGFIRNKDVHICPTGAVALYLFQLFHVDQEPFPSFRQAQDWYDIKFLRGRNRTSSITYGTHKKCYEAVFNYLGLTFNKKTHINRQQGVRQLESADVDISQTRRHGRWDQDTCEAIYAAPLAREAMRALSGHPVKSRLYYLERATLDPPSELQHLAFPDIEHCQKQISEGNWEDNLAAREFLELLQYLRNVFLQECTVLFDHLPAQIRQNHILGDSFQQFRTQALFAVAAAQNPVEMKLQIAMPLLSERLATQHAEVIGRLDSRHTEIVQLLKDTQESLTSLLGGEMAFRLLPVANAAASNDSTASTFIEISASISTSSDTQASNNVPQYTMSRGVCTVRELWQEWHVGFSNHPSIEHLEQTYGRKWRLSSKEAKFFSRRLCVIKYVCSLVSRGLSVESALDRADVERGRRSIDAFSKYINSKKTQ